MSEKVVVERTFRASVQEIWELWTTKDGFESWWGPDGFRVEVHAIEPRVGGALRYDMIAATPQMIAAMEQMGQPARHGTHGRFSLVEPMRRLAITHVIDFVAGVAPYDNTMAVELFPAGDSVRMVVTIDPHVDEHWTRMSKEGFESQLGKLERRYGAAGRA